VELLGDLAARIAGADDEDGAWGERFGMAIAPGMDLVDVGGHPGGDRRHPWGLVRASGHHDALGDERTSRRPEGESAVR
jgi:hypothetical protein